MTSRPPRLTTIRPLTPADDDALDTVLTGMSPTSRRARYFQPLEQLTPSMRASLLDVDDVRHVGFVAQHGLPGRKRAIGLARYAVTSPGSAEIAYEVVDAWHGRGVGTALARTLVEAARRNGVQRIEASVLADNETSLRVLRRVLPHLHVRRHDGDTLEVTASLADEPLTIELLIEELFGTAAPLTSPG